MRGRRRQLPTYLDVSWVKGPLLFGTPGQSHQVFPGFPEEKVDRSEPPPLAPHPLLEQTQKKDITPPSASRPSSRTVRFHLDSVASSRFGACLTFSKLVERHDVLWFAPPGQINSGGPKFALYLSFFLPLVDCLHNPATLLHTVP